MQRHHGDDRDGDSKEAADRAPEPCPERQCQDDHERVDRELASQHGRGDEVTFDGREGDEGGDRAERIAERGKCDEAAAEQDRTHAGGADIGHVVEDSRKRSEDERVRKSEQPGPRGDDSAEPDVDSRHREDISRQSVLDPVGDANEQQLAGPGHEEGRHISAKVHLCRHEENQRHEEQCEFYGGRCDECNDRAHDAPLGLLDRNAVAARGQERALEVA